MIQNQKKKELDPNDYVFHKTQESSLETLCDEINREISGLRSQIEILEDEKRVMEFEYSTMVSNDNNEVMQRLRRDLEEFHGILESNPLRNIIWAHIINSSQLVNATGIIEKYGFLVDNLPSPT